MKSVVKQWFFHEFAFNNKALKTFVEFRICWKCSFERCRIRIRTSSHLYRHVTMAFESTMRRSVFGFNCCCCWHASEHSRLPGCVLIIDHTPIGVTTGDDQLIIDWTLNKRSLTSIAGARIKEVPQSVTAIMFNHTA